MIQTARLIIRPFHEADRDCLVELLMDGDFMVYSNSGPLSFESANNRFDQILNFTTQGLGKQAIVLIESGETIGYCGFEPFILNGAEELELGYRLVSSQRGRGIATEATQAILANMPNRELFAYADQQNTKSISVLQRIGFQNCGECMVNEKAYPLFRYSLRDGKGGLSI